MGGILVTAKIIPFAARGNRKREPVRSSSIAFRPALRRGDLATDQADTAPSEYVSSSDVPGSDLKND
jgi:hypothetical protein